MKENWKHGVLNVKSVECFLTLWKYKDWKGDESQRGESNGIEMMPFKVERDGDLPSYPMYVVTSM